MLFSFFIGRTLSSDKYDELCKLIRKSYPNACVLYIDEVLNDELYENYILRKTILGQLRGPIIKELQLFHGTSHTNIQNIATNGFLKEYNKTSAYGRGTYFSTKASYSYNYSNIDPSDVSYMFVCDVLIGNCNAVYGAYEIDTSKYDNSVDNLNNPTIYVTPYNDGCYPRYLIAFHKNAK